MQKKKGRLMRVEGGDRIESVRGGVRRRERCMRWRKGRKGASTTDEGGDDLHTIER